LVATDVLAQTRPDFTGHWTIDPTANSVMGGRRGGPGGVVSGGGGRGGGGSGMGAPAQEVVIQQTDSTMTIEDRTTGLVLLYRLDGRRTTSLVTVGQGNTIQVTYSPRWDGTKLITTIARTNPRSLENTYLREVRSLADDGSMIVETDVTTGSGGRRTVYRKATAAP
jgi:hypothetical protein